MKRKTVQTKYDVPVRRAFRWASEQQSCSAEASMIVRIPAPWLTKEIIFVCTVFLSFTLRMTCERTLIHAQFTLWTAPQNLPIYVMELLVIRWTPMREWQKPIYILKVIFNKLYMSFWLSFYIFSNVRKALFYRLYGHFAFVVNLTYLGLSSYIFAINRG